MAATIFKSIATAWPQPGTCCNNADLRPKHQPESQNVAAMPWQAVWYRHAVYSETTAIPAVHNQPARCYPSQKSVGATVHDGLHNVFFQGLFLWLVLPVLEIM